MTEKEFRRKVKEEDISSNIYSIDQLKEDAICTRDYHGIWEVFYFERGREYDKKMFYSENEAYSYFYDKVKNLHLCHKKYDVEI